jgi:hypothetical protein
LGYVEISFADHKEFNLLQGCQFQGVSLKFGDFVGLSGIRELFREILKVSDNGAFLVRYY